MNLPPSSTTIELPTMFEIDAARKTLSMWGIFALTCTAVFLVSLDGTIMFAAFPAVRAAFPNVSPSELSWILNAYTIVFAALLVPSGRLADMLGRKRLFLLGLIIFTLASVACGIAPNQRWLILFRAVQACGAALLMPSSLALILAAFPPEKRNIAVSLWGAIGALAAAVGPSLGALLIDLTNWQMAFLLNLPVGLTAWWMGRSRLAESRRPELGARLDVIGTAMIAIGVGLMTLGIVQSNAWGWLATATVSSLGGGVAILVLFLFWASGRSTAALDLTLFADRNYRYVNLATFVFGIVFSMMFLSSFLFLTGIWHYSLSLAGFGIAIGPLVVIPVAIVSGRVAARIGHRTILVAGGLIYAVSAIWYFINVGDEPSYLRVWLPGQLLGGLGVGLVLPSLSGAAVAGLAAHRFGIGSAVNVAIRQIGGVIGVAAAIAIVGLPGAGIERYRVVYICMTAGGIFTALLSIPVNTRRKKLAPSASVEMIGDTP